MGYLFDGPCVSPSTAAPNVQACNQGFEQPRGNAAMNDELALQKPVNITVSADDGPAATAISVVVAGLQSEETGRFPDLNGAVDQALEVAGGRPIGRLSIVIHGTPGRMWMGDKAVDYLSSGPVAAAFARLRGHFSADGAIELNSCNLAQYPEDSVDVLVSQMALAAGVPVIAPQSAQASAWPGLEGSTVTWTPQADGTTARSTQPHPVGDTIMGGLEAGRDLLDWIFGP